GFDVDRAQPLFFGLDGPQSGLRFSALGLPFAVGYLAGPSSNHSFTVDIAAFYDDRIIALPGEAFTEDNLTAEIKPLRAPDAAVSGATQECRSGIAELDPAVSGPPKRVRDRDADVGNVRTVIDDRIASQASMSREPVTSLIVDEGAGAWPVHPGNPAPP